MIDKIGKTRGYLLQALPYCLIFSLRVSDFILALIIGISILWGVLGSYWKFNHTKLLIASGPFLITLLGLLYTINFSLGLKDTEIRASIALLPIAFSLKPPTLIELGLFFKHLILALVLTFFAALTIALYRNGQNPIPHIWLNKYYFHYNDFTNPLRIDPLYISLYLSSAIIFLEMDLLKSSTLFTEMSDKWKIIFIALLVIFLAMVGTRSWIGITMVMGIGVLTFSRTTRKMKVIILFVFIGLLILIVSLPVTRGRFTGTFSYQFEFSKYKNDRLVIWSTALEFIKKNPEQCILGCGTGGSNQLMDGLYLEKNITWDFAQKNNTHNQYLNFLLNQGVIGIIVLGLYLMFPLLSFVKLGHWTGVCFITLIALGLFFENYLDRQKGVVFISMVYTLLFFGDQPTLENSKMKDPLRKIGRTPNVMI
jgi:O-antigen ligase